MFPVGAAPSQPSGRPKLVVLLAVDQMRADYIKQYGGTWKHGLRRLVDRGALFRKARFPYLGTVTCPGHVTLGTGAYPHTHGMVLNGWWDRAQGKLTECTADPASRHRLLRRAPGRKTGTAPTTCWSPRWPTR